MSGHPQFFRIAVEAEVRSNAVFYQISHVFNIQRCQKPGLIVRPDASKGPFQIGQLIEPRGPRQEMVRAYALCKRRVPVLQEIHDQVHGLQIVLLIAQDAV